MNVILILIGAIAVTSYLGFQKSELMYRYQFNAWQIVHRREYHRLFTHGFFHGSWTHLIVNMLVLWSFSNVVLSYFAALSGSPQLLYVLFFVTALVVSSLYSLARHKNNYNYNAIGASGAVSAVVFTSIFFDPYNPIYLFAIVPIPGILFGVLYLWYSYYMSKKESDLIGHDAHFWGAVYGFVFPIVFWPRLLPYFFSRLLDF